MSKSTESKLRLDAIESKLFRDLKSKNNDGNNDYDAPNHESDSINMESDRNTSRASFAYRLAQRFFRTSK